MSFEPKILKMYKSEFRNELFPPNFRLLLVGDSGCGKNVLLMEMLSRPGFLDYNNLIFYSTTINQPELKLFKATFENGLTKYGLVEIFNNQEKLIKMTRRRMGISDKDNIPSQPRPEDLVLSYKNFLTYTKDITEEEKKLLYNDEPTKDRISVTFSNRSKDIIACDDLPKDKKNLIIFDDVVNLEDQKIMKSYFTRGRHNNCNVIYISQSFYGLDKNSIRNNSNCFIFFELNKRDRNLIFNDLFPYEKELIEQKILNHWETEYNYIYYNKKTREIYKDIFSKVLI